MVKYRVRMVCDSLHVSRAFRDSGSAMELMSALVAAWRFVKCSESRWLSLVENRAFIMGEL